MSTVYSFWFFKSTGLELKGWRNVRLPENLRKFSLQDGLVNIKVKAENVEKAEKVAKDRLESIDKV